jgi:ATP-dependent DNA helicase RecQ
MKCKTFKIQLSKDDGGFEEARFNKFLDTVIVRQTFAEVVSGEYWSILVFYEEAGTVFRGSENISPPSTTKTSLSNPKSAAEKPANESEVLSAEQERKFNALKNWRNERAAADGVPPYLIAQNDSLMQIASADKIENAEDLMNIKGFGEKRAQKYGEEILRILSE